VKVLIATEGHVTTSNDHDLSQGDLLLRELIGHVPSTRSNVEKLKESLQEFAFRVRRIGLNEDFNIFDFWSKLKHSEKFFMMAKLSKMILSAPFTQVPVERAFSVFALTLTHLRTRLDDDILNAILVARENSDLIDRVNFL